MRFLSLLFFVLSLVFFASARRPEKKFSLSSGTPNWAFNAKGPGSFMPFYIPATDSLILSSLTAMRTASTAFYNERLHLDTSFYMKFDLAIEGNGLANDSPCDGIAAVFHNDPMGLQAIGQWGSGLGYSHDTSVLGIRNSVALLMTACPDPVYTSNGFQFVSNGAKANLAAFQSISPQKLGVAQLFSIELFYSVDSASWTFSISSNQSSETFSAQTPGGVFNLTSLAGTQVFTGFSASTGGGTAIFTLSSVQIWQKN